MLDGLGLTQYAPLKPKDVGGSEHVARGVGPVRS
jgi:hypothetical protein